MREIRVGKSRVALVDDEDFERVSRHKWHSHDDGRTCYARMGRRHGRMMMHAFILGSEPGMVIDHKNRNGLDNRKGNLRFATEAQNTWNCGTVRGQSKYKGVCRRNDRWLARICISNRKVDLGSFSEEAEAARAYNLAACHLRGEFAVLNFPGRKAEYLATAWSLPVHPPRTGARYLKGMRKWTAVCRAGGRRRRLGYFDTQEEAAQAMIRAKQDVPR